MNLSPVAVAVAVVAVASGTVPFVVPFPPPTTIGTPASAQVCSTVAVTFAVSSAEHAAATHGKICAPSCGWAQWQAKSSMVAQPSVVRAVRKQENCGGV